MKKIKEKLSGVAEKNVKMSERAFKTGMSISVLTMLVCCAILCSSAFAWYNSQQTSPVAAINSTTYSLSVKIGGEVRGTCNSIDSVTYTCPLAQNDMHTFTLEATGTAANGYCIIDVGNGTVYIANVTKGESRTLSIRAARGTVISFTASWGSYDGDTLEGNLIELSGTPYVEYTVVPGDTLDAIAERYGVPVADIIAFNGITDVYNLAVDSVIRIPNAVIGEPTTVSGENGNVTSDTSETETTTTANDTDDTTVAATDETTANQSTTVTTSGVTESSETTTEATTAETTTTTETAEKTTTETQKSVETMATTAEAAAAEAEE